MIFRIGKKVLVNVSLILKNNSMTDETVRKARARAEQWLSGKYDEETKKQVQQLLVNDEKELVDAFYCNLEFGTGGMRGIMGPGTNRMNVYTVAMATQGLCNYIKEQCAGQKDLKAVVAYDSRNNSFLFAETTAKVFAANGLSVYLFSALRPTPELSFAVRHLGCICGVVITASHNPKEYNGYKAYWSDGGQVVPPHDTNIIKHVQKISSIDEVLISDDTKSINIIDKEVDGPYLKNIVSLSLSPQSIQKHSDLKIVFTALHGTGITMVPPALKAYGFKNIIIVPQQDIPDGNFPTVKSPNPEEAAALDAGLKIAIEQDADLLLSTDPDADRVGIATKNHKGQFVLLNGNQTGALLVYYLLTQWKERKKLTGKEFVVKTIVTTELIADMAKKYGVKYFDVLTGFKFIAEIIRLQEGKMTFIGGGEESYGYLAGDFVRDKDAVIASVLIAEMTAWIKEQGKSLFDLLIDLYLEFGMYKESLLNITKKGKEGQEEIQRMMENYRNAPPQRINGSDVVLIHDYQKQQTIDMISDLRYQISLPKSNVLQFICKDGSKISIRPSGTEPKIKFYFGVKEQLVTADDFDAVDALLTARIEAIQKDMGLL